MTTYMIRNTTSDALAVSALALAANIPDRPARARRTWQPKNYGDERKRRKAEKANKQARKSRQRNRK